MSPGLYVVPFMCEGGCRGGEAGFNSDGGARLTEPRGPLLAGRRTSSWRRPATWPCWACRRWGCPRRRIPRPASVSSPPPTANRSGHRQDGKPPTVDVETERGGASPVHQLSGHLDWTSEYDHGTDDSEVKVPAALYANSEALATQGFGQHLLHEFPSHYLIEGDNFIPRVPKTHFVAYFEREKVGKFIPPKWLIEASLCRLFKSIFLNSACCSNCARVVCG